MANCPDCGSLDYYVKDGSKLCSECGAENINFVEVEDDDFNEAEEFKTRFVIESKVLQDTYSQDFESNAETGANNVEDEESQETEQNDWTTYEIFNIILKSWTEVLLSLGATSSLKEAVYYLWIRLLQKKNIAFIKNIQVKDLKNDMVKNPVHYYLRDIKILNENALKWNLNYNTGRNKQMKNGQLNKVIFGRRSRKKIYQSFNTNESEKAPLEKHETTNYESSDEEKDPLMTSDSSDSDELVEAPKVNVNTFSTYVKGPREEKFKYTLNLEKMLSLMYLAILVSKQDILLSDLLRWCREGHFPYQSAAYLIPEHFKITPNDHLIFERSLPAEQTVRRYAYSIARDISLKYVRLPSYKYVLKNFVLALNLPVEIQKCAESALIIIRKIRKEVGLLPSVELNVAAAILLAFKVTFGLDDVQETLFSNYADQFNQIFSSENRPLRLFSWIKWQSYINRLQWWLQQVNPGVTSDEFNPKMDVKRFSQYYWTIGLWNIPISNKSTPMSMSISPELLNQYAELTSNTIDNLVGQKKLFYACKIPFRGMLKQYIEYGYDVDMGSDRDTIRRIAEELNAIDFSNNRFNWPCHTEEIEDNFIATGFPIKIVKKKITNENFDLFANEYLSNKEFFENVQKKERNEGSTQPFFENEERLCQKWQGQISKTNEDKSIIANDRNKDKNSFNGEESSFYISGENNTCDKNSGEIDANKTSCDEVEEVNSNKIGQKDDVGKNNLRDSDKITRINCVDELERTKRDINNVEVNKSIEKLDKSDSNIIEKNRSDDKIGGNESNHDRKSDTDWDNINESKNNDTKEILISDPCSNLWRAFYVKRNSLASSGSDTRFQSFKWLLQILCKLCETQENVLLILFKSMEENYLTNSRTVKGKRRTFRMKDPQIHIFS